MPFHRVVATAGGASTTANPALTIASEKAATAKRLWRRRSVMRAWCHDLRAESWILKVFNVVAQLGTNVYDQRIGGHTVVFRIHHRQVRRAERSRRAPGVVVCLVLMAILALDHGHPRVR